MKKIRFYVLLSAVLLMSACGTGEKENVVNREGQQSASVIETPKEVETVDAQEIEEEARTDQVENSAFRNIEVSGKNGEYVVQGEANTSAGIFYYTVEDGHDYIVEEMKVELSNAKGVWETFTINLSIPEENLPQKGALTLELYEKIDDQSTNNELFIKLDEFNN